MKAFRSLDGVERGGKPRLTFNPLKAINSTNPISIPCGGCIGCRTRKMEEWGVRCTHEAQMHERSSFITLTYDDEHLPDDYSVRPRILQLFMKKLRKSLVSKIRFFGVGEYGEENLRPHYHALIFGYDFSSDRKHWKDTPDGPLYTSEALEKVWGNGFCTIGSVDAKSARYCAGYTLKKIGGDKAASHYLRHHPKGHLVAVLPEFHRASNRPGIGESWFRKYHADCFPSDFLVVDGKQVQVPLYYFRKLKEEEAKALKRSRTAKRVKVKDNATKERLAVREFIKTDRISRLKRDL